MDILFYLLLIVAVFHICGIYVDSCKGKHMIRVGALTTYDKKLILEIHNRYRQSVALGQVHGQPMAQNMRELKWDDELAARAQHWAEECVTGHDQRRHVARFPVGQNIAITWTTRAPNSIYDMNPEFDQNIAKWFNEVRKYGYRRIGYGGHTGHYSQLVWSETSLVGCGYTFYFDPARGYTKAYVCNYGPGGNVLGAKPYEAGPPSCERYGLKPSTHYPGLCDGQNLISDNSYIFPHHFLG